MKTLNELLEALSGTEFYDQLSDPNFKYQDMFKIDVPVKDIIKDKNVKTSIELKIPIDTTRIERYVDAYIKPSAELKEKYDTYAYWYNNFNKLIFNSMEESDACLFLAASAFTSANTALDQNILEAAKLFSAVISDYDRGAEGIRDLEFIVNNIKDNNTNENISKLEELVNRGSAYAALLAPKIDYKGGQVKQGARKGQLDVFSEITVSNAKIPNFNMFVKYYLERGGKITKDQVMNDIRTGKIEVGGTKINSFLMNLIEPDYKWQIDKPGSIAITPATIDRWMIRVFFYKPLSEIVDQFIETGIISGEEDDPEKAEKAKKRDPSKIVIEKKEKIMASIIMKLFGDDVVRQNVARILNMKSAKAGLNAQQLQALAWVQVREEFGEPKAKFAKFEDVMEYSTETTDKIEEIKNDINFIEMIGKPMKGKFNEAIRTINILSMSPRFKFKDPKDVKDTIVNRNLYKKVYYLPPKEAKKAKKPVTWLQTRVALTDDEKTAQVFFLSASKRKPVYTARGDNRVSTLRNAMDWIYQNV
jgi:hypothetical protein